MHLDAPQAKPPQGMRVDFPMSRSHCCLRYLFSLWLLSLVPGWAAAQIPAETRPVRQTPSRMRVIENQPESMKPALYTVVGAISQPGVYVFPDRTIPVRKLMEIAGGLAPQAQPTLRIVRNREVRFQLAFQPDRTNTDEWLLPGDIVVVPARTPSTPEETPLTVPVACVGLLDRPVVLPLAPSIATVQELVRRLGQRPELGETAAVIAPIRREGPPELMTGSVILFDSRFVDRLPLQQPGFLPPAIEPGTLRTSAVPGPVPVTAKLPPNVPPAQIVQRTSADMIVPPLRVPEATPGHPLANQSLAITTEHSFRRQDTVTASASDAQGRSPSEQHQPPETTLSVQKLPPDLAQAMELFASTSKTDAPGTSTSARVKSAGASQKENIRPAVVHPVTPVETSGSVITKTSAEKKGGASAKNSSSSPIRSLPEGVTGSTLAKKTLSRPAQTRKPSNRILEYLFYCGGALSLLIGSSLLISVAFNTKFHSPAIQISAAAPGSDPVSTPPETGIPFVEEPIHQGTLIGDILNRSLPIVEESIQIPNSWPLHGKAIGHRRCHLNSSHAGVSGPHFGHRQKSPEYEKVGPESETAAERLLRNHLREICRPNSEISGEKFELEELLNSCMKEPSHLKTTSGETEAPAGPMENRNPLSDDSELKPDATDSLTDDPPRNPLEATSFDIVQPQPVPPPHSSAMSPLERALRTLATEKHG